MLSQLAGGGAAAAPGFFSILQVNAQERSPPACGQHRPQPQTETKEKVPDWSLKAWVHAGSEGL